LSDWLVAIARKSAIAKLAARFNVYSPVSRIRERWRGTMRWVVRPVLGKYLLIEIISDWTRQFYEIIGIRGVHGVLMHSEKLLVVREEEVQQLRDREVRGYIPGATKFRFRRDQKVLIHHGPFAHLEGTFRRERGALDVVEIMLFGSKREIMLPMGSVVSV
jgi:transcription antitermination factor NusG